MCRALQEASEGSGYHEIMWYLSMRSASALVVLEHALC